MECKNEHNKLYVNREIILAPTVTVIKGYRELLGRLFVVETLHGSISC